MKKHSTALLICVSFFMSACQAEAPQAPARTAASTVAKKAPNSAPEEADVSSFDQKLMSDLDRADYANVANEWSELYDKLGARFKNTVHTPDSEYKMDYGDLYGLNKGFSWGLCGKYIDNEVGDAIVDGFGATGGKSRTDEERGYRAGMVYFYVKHQLLKCE